MRDIKKNTDRIKLFFKHRSNTLSFFGLNQYVDWHIIVSITIIILAASVVVAGSFYVYVIQGKDAFDITPEAITRSPIQEDAIKKVLEQYMQKQASFDALKIAPYEYPSPEM